MLEQAELRFEMKAGPTGSLFGSVTATDIADELWEKHKVRVDRRKIELPQPIKQRRPLRDRRSASSRTSRREVATLVVGVLPDGSELPPEAVADEEPTAEAEQPADEPVEEHGRGAGRGAEPVEEPAERAARASSRGQDESCPRFSGIPQRLWRAVEYRTNFPRRAAFSSTVPSGQPSTMVGTNVLFEPANGDRGAGCGGVDCAAFHPLKLGPPGGLIPRGPHSTLADDRPGPAAESRCRRVRSRRDDALPRRDRGGQRGDVAPPTSTGRATRRSTARR